MQKCPQCGAMVPPGLTKCPKCGAPLPPAGGAPGGGPPMGMGGGAPPAPGGPPMFARGTVGEGGIRQLPGRMAQERRQLGFVGHRPTMIRGPQMYARGTVKQAGGQTGAGGEGKMPPDDKGDAESSRPNYGKGTMMSPNFKNLAQTMRARSAGGRTGGGRGAAKAAAIAARFRR